VPYPTAAAAKSAFASVQKNLDKYLKPVTATPGRLVFKDYENKFGVVSVAGPRLELRLHLAKEPK
jgi:predicted metal-dependent hydrolase